MSLSRSQWITVAAALVTPAAVALWAIVPAGGSVWLAISTTVIVGVIWTIARVEHCHDETRRYNEDLVNGLAECVAERMVQQIYEQVTSKLLEHRAQTDAAQAAAQRYRRLMGTGTENDAGRQPTNLQAWREDRSADGAPRN